MFFFADIISFIVQLRLDISCIAVSDCHYCRRSCVGLISISPQYYEIWKHGEVIGISILFMLVDLMGGVFSDLSLVFKKKLDIIAAVTYSIVVVSHFVARSLRA